MLQSICSVSSPTLTRNSRAVPQSQIYRQLLNVHDTISFELTNASTVKFLRNINSVALYTEMMLLTCDTTYNVEFNAVMPQMALSLPGVIVLISDQSLYFEKSVYEKKQNKIISSLII